MIESDNRYQNGKIYTIRSNQTDKFYVGSTCLTLCQRLYAHRRAKKSYETQNNKRYTSSFEILKFDDHYIELLEEYKCENKSQLERREGELIRMHKENVVNLMIAGRTKKEYKDENKELTKQQNKKYKEQHKERLSIAYKKYYYENRDSISEKYKKYCEKNKEQLSKARKEQYNPEKTKQYNDNHKAERKRYYEENRDKIRQKLKERYERKKANKIIKKIEDDTLKSNVSEIRQ
jgi:hypothetical protein